MVRTLARRSDKFQSRCVVESAMKMERFRQPEIETTSKNADSTRVVNHTAEMSCACPTPEQPFPVRTWRVVAAFASAHEAMAQWRRRVRTRNKLTTLSDDDLRDIRKTRAEVEAERCRAFWWA
jgi:uncharacterized protein YjiS (DUF1127 family)